jgi:hypothetical protein
MERIRQYGIVLIAWLLLLNGSLPPAAWAQSAPPTTEEPRDGQGAIVGLTNLAYVPGKAIACTLSAALWGGLMALSLGGYYKDAAVVLYEGCGGKWTVKAKDLDLPR